MRNYFRICFVLSLFLLTSCATLQNWIKPGELQTYTFNYNGQEYSALLPEEVPVPSEFSKMSPFCYYWLGPLCAMHIRYIEEKVHPTVSFWFTEKQGILAVVYHVEIDGVANHTPYLYVDGMPVLVTAEEIQEKLEKWSKAPK